MIKGILAFILGCLAFLVVTSFAPSISQAMGMSLNPWVNFGLGFAVLGLTVTKVVD